MLLMMALLVPQKAVAKPMRVAVIIQDRHGNVIDSKPAPKNISEDSIVGALTRSQRFIVVNTDHAANIRRFRGQDLSDEGRVQKFLTEVDVDIIVTGTAWYSKVENAKYLKNLSIWSVVATLSVFTADSARILDGQQFTEVGKGHWDGQALSSASGALGATVAAAVETSLDRALVDSKSQRVLLEVKLRPTWTPAMTRELQSLIGGLPGVSEVSVHMQSAHLLVMYILHETAFEQLSAELEELSLLLKHVGSSGGKISLQHIGTRRTLTIAPRVTLRLNPEQPSLYTAWREYYEQAPLAELTITNGGKASVKIMSVILTCGDGAVLVLDQPSVNVSRGREVSIPLRLQPETDALREIKQTEVLLCRIVVKWKSGSRVLRRSLQTPIVVHAPNTMTWDVGRGEGVAAFVTPQAASVRKTIDDLMACTSLTSTSGIMMRFAAAFASVCGWQSSNQQSTDISGANISLRTPSDTLARKGGTSAELSLVLASMLEHLDVPVALVRTPRDLLVAAQIKWPLAVSIRPDSTFQHEEALYAAVKIRDSDCSFRKAREGAGRLLRATSAGARLIDVRAGWQRGFGPVRVPEDTPARALTRKEYTRVQRILRTHRRHQRARIQRLQKQSLGSEAADSRYRASVELALLGKLKEADFALSALDRDAKTMLARGNVAYFAGDTQSAMRFFAEALQYRSDAIDVIWNAAFVGYDRFRNQASSKDDFDKHLARLFRADPTAESALLKAAQEAQKREDGLRAAAARILRWML